MAFCFPTGTAANDYVAKTIADQSMNVVVDALVKPRERLSAKVSTSNGEG